MLKPQLSTKFMAITCGLMLAAFITVKPTAAEKPKLDVGGIDQAGGTIKGVVKFEGRQVRPRPIRMDADKFCADTHKETEIFPETYVFGNNDTLQNVLVYVSKGLEGKTFPAPSTSADLDQIGCVYTPHVSAVVAGQELVIHNSDDTLHNVKMQSASNGRFNEGMPVKGMQKKVKFDKPEFGMTFKCDVHPWMAAYLHVMEHPFFAITQADGTFEIKGLPAGEYELSVWHEFDRFAPSEQTIKVTVSEGQTQEVTFTYAPKKRD